MTLLIDATFAVSDSIDNGRSIENVLTHMMTEVGELALEISIDQGRSYKDASEDGVVGEAVDVILCALDVIRLYDPSITAEDILAIAHRKLAKWVEKEEEICKRPYWIDLPSSDPKSPVDYLDI
jgi:hypothetical protein